MELRQVCPEFENLSVQERVRKGGALLVQLAKGRSEGEYCLLRTSWEGWQAAMD